MGKLITKINYILLIVILILLYILYKETFYYFASGYLNFKNPQENVYIENVISKKGHNIILNRITTAKKLLKQECGKLISNPKIVVAVSKKMSENLQVHDLGGKACKVFGQTYIGINHGQITVETIAHEIIHAEINERIHKKRESGYIFPLWLEEGLAMQSYYFKDPNKPYEVVSTQIIEEITKKTTKATFYDSNIEKRKSNYKKAQKIVRLLLSKKEESMFELLDKVGSGISERIVFNY